MDYGSLWFDSLSFFISFSHFSFSLSLSFFTLSLPILLTSFCPCQHGFSFLSSLSPCARSGNFGEHFLLLLVPLSFRVSFWSQVICVLFQFLHSFAEKCKDFQRETERGFCERNAANPKKRQYFLPQIPL